MNSNAISEQHTSLVIMPAPLGESWIASMARRVKNGMTCDNQISSGEERIELFRHESHRFMKY